MKKLMAVALALGVVSSAMAQLLQVGQTAARVDIGAISTMVGFSVGNGKLDSMVNGADVRVVGARCSMGVIENLLIVGDVGLATFDVKDAELKTTSEYKMGIGVAAQFTLPVEFVDLAVRVGMSAISVGDLSDRGAINAMLMVSTRVEAVDGLAVYGGAGIINPLKSDYHTSAVVDLGATYGLAAICKDLSMYGEVTYATEDVGVGVGAGVVYGF